MRKLTISSQARLKLWSLLLIVVFCILEVTILNYFRIFGVKPDLFLIFMLLTSIVFTFELKWALFFSIFAGILKDSLVINTFGINTLLFPLWSFLIIRLSRNILIESNFIYALLIAIVAILHDMAARMILLSLGNFIPLAVFLRIMFLESFYTALILPLVFRLAQPVLTLLHKFK
jgi:rod shape-determining protein MreD